MYRSHTWNEYCSATAMARNPLTPLVLATGLLVSSSVYAAQYGGIEFPGGAASFADSVILYNPAFGGGNVPTNANYTDPSSAIGAPDYAADIGSVSLGAGGRLVVQFTDNFLTGSNSAAYDLHIFEIGPDVEDTDVDISKDGIEWFSVGKVFGSTDSIDIDFYGFTSADLFSFVRLTDVKGEGATSGSTVGADIDAIGAITTIPRDSVPDGGSAALMVTFALLGLVGLRRKLSQSA